MNSRFTTSPCALLVVKNASRDVRARIMLFVFATPGQGQRHEDAMAGGLTQREQAKCLS
jgi:hypothetical protein